MRAQLIAAGHQPDAATSTTFESPSKSMSQTFSDNIVRDNLTSLPDPAKHRIMGGNAERFYLRHKSHRTAHS